MDETENECQNLLCPEQDHPEHDECHQKSKHSLHLFNIIDENIENIPPQTYNTFRDKYTVIFNIFHACTLTSEFAPFLKEIEEFNNVLQLFISNRIFN